MRWMEGDEEDNHGGWAGGGGVRSKVEEDGMCREVGGQKGVRNMENQKVEEVERAGLKGVKEVGGGGGARKEQGWRVAQRIGVKGGQRGQREAGKNNWSKKRVINQWKTVQ